MTLYFLDNQEQQCHLSFLQKRRILIKVLFFLSQRACWVEGQNRPDSQKIIHLFLHAQACLKRPIFQQIKTQCYSEGIPISYRRLSATKKHHPRPINLRLLQPELFYTARNFNRIYQRKFGLSKIKGYICTRK